ncbi:Trm112 family protein [Testudinibacter sp. TR-2022]|uniref:Trm112 family protein n=1 Tax=Testudinibacter sp. TR-2022 TaxID=2585029 RepID=UPI00111B8B66|nr:Trm112 family protein [Testudinibacter sp. TR-2022]TNH06397.1 Trm112 family protein [Pasteurellaceae bacterium Phil11]TNH22163.1 Trm112 family protein [Testudinibacter sp. TR-2022]TNH28836.1 Trm112 family protein [Testudinibacter sp. TR-2022]
MNTKLLQVVACPRCHAKLQYDQPHQRLICEFEHLAYPIKNGIPVLLPESAVALTMDEQPLNKKTLK